MGLLAAVARVATNVLHAVHPTPADPVPAAAVEIVEGFEGFSAKVYPDPGTHGAPWSQGFGSTRDIHGRPLTPHSPAISTVQARALLVRDLADAAADVSRDVKVALNDNQRSALISLVYNIGVTAFAGSDLLRLLNAGNFAGAANQFLVWNRGGGRVMPGLVARRAAERKLFTTPLPIAGAPVKGPA